MITHRSNASALFLNNNDDDMFIWLQVSRPNGKPCCPGHGAYPYNFDFFLKDRNDWVMYRTASCVGKVHVFRTVKMVHKSRVDQLGCDTNERMIYNNGSLINGKKGGFEYSPVEFLESSWDLGIGLRWDHIHVLLYYPAALDELRAYIENDLDAYGEDELRAYIENDLDAYGEDELRAYIENDLDAYGEDELRAYIENDLDAYGEDELETYGEDELETYGEDELGAYIENELDAYGEDELGAYIENELEAYSGRETPASDGAFLEALSQLGL
ncbi:hypothetical protein CPB97_000425 [Podila verticillata]|nr:hypothetical protein CPB97_000425 [Podila verticillata]